VSLDKKQAAAPITKPPPSFNSSVVREAKNLA
jgi:hypothetical protein